MTVNETEFENLTCFENLTDPKRMRTGPSILTRGSATK